MSPTIAYTIISLSLTGIIAAVILYAVARRFTVHEDPRIDEIEQALPQVNCGACGYPGCRKFAEAVVTIGTISDLYCPVGGSECMAAVARILGKESVAKAPMVSVVRCAGASEYREKKNHYDGIASCVISHNFYIGETDCAYGCLGFGDCVTACAFDAIYMDQKTGLPVVVEDACIACGACVKACPRAIIEIRKKGPKGRRIFVSCVSKDKGAVARKACAVACIGCGMCVKECRFGAITLEKNLAYIDFNACTLCKKCAPVCPTGAIHEINFPLPKNMAPERKPVAHPQEKP